MTLDTFCPLYATNFFDHWYENNPHIRSKNKADKTRLKNDLRKHFTGTNSKFRETSDVLAIVAAGRHELDVVFNSVDHLVRSRFIRECLGQLPEGYITNTSVKEWSSTSHLTKRYFRAVHARQSGEARAFTLRLTGEIQETIFERLHTNTPTSPAELMKRRIARELNKIGIQSPLIWFVIEFDDEGAPHLHGIVDTHQQSTERGLRKLWDALKAAGGADTQWIIRASDKQRAFRSYEMLKTEKLERNGWLAPFYWSAYCIKSLKLKGHKGTGMEFCCKEWAQGAQKLYSQIRSIIKAESM